MSEVSGTLDLKPGGENLVIWGPNGSGKSAVIDAVDFLFAGRMRRLIGEGTAGITLKKHGPHIDAGAEDPFVRGVVQQGSTSRVKDRERGAIDVNRKIPVLLVVLSIALTPGVQADERYASDPDDVEGTFDLASASHGHGNVTSQLVHSLGTYEPWTNEEFHGAHIRFWLPDGDRAYDRILHVTTNPDDSLTAAMTSLDAPHTPFRGYANVYRTDETSFEIVMPVRLLAPNLRSYRWKAYLFYDNCTEGAHDETCSGYDSHEGRVRHVIRSP